MPCASAILTVPSNASATIVGPITCTAWRSSCFEKTCANRLEGWVVFGEKSERLPVYIGTSIGPERAVICRERKMARIRRPMRSIYQVIGGKYQVALNRETSALIRSAPASISTRIVIANTSPILATEHFPALHRTEQKSIRINNVHLLTALRRTKKHRIPEQSGTKSGTRFCPQACGFTIRCALRDSNSFPNDRLSLAAPQGAICVDSK